MKGRRRSSCYGFTSMFAGLVLWFITFQIALSFPALLYVSEPLPYFNKSLDAPLIDIPDTTFLSKRTLSWADASAKGTRLLCRLENPALLNDQSSVTSTDMLAASGWVRYNDDVNMDVIPMLQPFISQNNIDNNPAHFVGVRWRQEEDSRNSQGQFVLATGGRYVNVYNVNAGLITAYSNFSPAWMVRDKPIKILPDIKAWSDITYLEWETQAEASGQNVKGLSYIIRFEIANVDSTTIIEEAAGALSGIPWPGLTIPMSDARGPAILGTPNGAGIAFLLATHKAQLGEKTVESVQLWSRLLKTRYRTYIKLYAAFKIGPVASSSEPYTL